MTEDLFPQPKGFEPLAARLRPQRLADCFGQEHLTAKGRALEQAISCGHLHSMIFWGPPGVGKTTLAKLVAQSANAQFLQLSAVLAGVKDIRAAVEQAKRARARGVDTVLFVDEVHRFNKAQQDAFLPYVEEGTVIFIGATTENPSFELNNALLSRARVYKLRPLNVQAVERVIDRALVEFDKVTITSDALKILAQLADGDARRVLNLLEQAVDLTVDSDGHRIITEDTLSELTDGESRRFDKGGDVFYDQISALHKAVRGSSPDGALYWLLRMLDGGCDPLYIARRVVRMASEDIGNADPRALTLAMDAWQVQERLGSPEGELALAQAVTYLAVAAKSNAVYTAYKSARATVKNGGSEDVPLHLRNAPTQLLKKMEHGVDYRYAHDEPDAFAAGENYFPESLKDARFYEPVARGLEIKIREKLDNLRAKDLTSENKRYE